MAAPDRPATVVVADDDDLVRAVLRMALQTEDVVVREAATSAALSAELDATTVDLVILDISIPGPGLTENLCRIRSRAPGARVLILSGDSVVPPEDEHLVDDFAQKPIELDELRGRVGRLLARHTSSTP